MLLESEMVNKIAHLARLAIEQDNAPEYAEQLSQILQLVDQLSAVNTDNIEPMAHPLANTHQRLRPDEVTENDQHEQFQAIAPQVATGLYLVPKVIE